MNPVQGPTIGSKSLLERRRRHTHTAHIMASRPRDDTRPERKSAISQPGVFEQRVVVVRSGRAGEHYTPSEASRYTEANSAIEREMAVSCLGLLDTGNSRRSLLLDLGTGSALSAHVLCEAGHVCLGIDVAWAMLALARGSAGSSSDGGNRLELLHYDLGKGLPLRPGTVDGAISVAVLQWICDDPQAVAAFFAGLRACLAPSARAALQFYPTPSGAAAALAAAQEAGFGKAELFIDMPHATRGKKLLLAVQRSGAHSEVASSTEEKAQDSRGLCPLSWPMPAGCVCNGRWHRDGAPAVFPPHIRGGASCEAASTRGKEEGSHTEASRACQRIERLHDGRETQADENDVAPLTPVAHEVASGRAASISRLQHHHMKYVRRVMHSLMGNGAQAGQQQRQGGAQSRRQGKAAKRQRREDELATVSGTTIPDATPSQLPVVSGSAASLYIGGRCDRCLLLKVRGSTAACTALCDGLTRHLAACASHTGVRIEQALCEACEVTTKTAAADVWRNVVEQAQQITAMEDETAIRLSPLPIDGHAPHAAVRVSLLLNANGERVTDMGESSAGAAKLLVELMQAKKTRLVVCAMDVQIDVVSPCGDVQAMHVSLALRDRFASGAGFETAEEAQHLDIDTWHAEVRCVLAEIICGEFMLAIRALWL